jgi:hypothetical protein
VILCFLLSAFSFWLFGLPCQGGKGERREPSAAGWRCRSTQSAHATSNHIVCAVQATAAALGGGGLTKYGEAIND